jgi:hypothetical protein
MALEGGGVARLGSFAEGEVRGMRGALCGHMAGRPGVREAVHGDILQQGATAVVPVVSFLSYSFFCRRENAGPGRDSCRI